MRPPRKETQMHNRFWLASMVVVLGLLPYTTEANADESATTASDAKPYADYVMDCFATCGETDRPFAGRGFKWIAVSRALKACRTWASENGRDPDTCAIRECLPLDPNFGDNYSYLSNTGTKDSGVSCLDQAKQAYERELAVEDDSYLREREFCFRFPMNGRYEMCEYDASVRHDARVKSIDAAYEQARLACN